MNGLMKVPLQIFILFLGVMVFLFYQTHRAPVFFNDQVKTIIETSDRSEELKIIEEEYTLLLERRDQTNAALINAKRTNADIETLKQSVYNISLEERQIRDKVKVLIEQTDSNLESNDKDYVFISFILNNLPRGLVGLLLAVIFFAAMSSTASGTQCIGCYYYC